MKCVLCGMQGVCARGWVQRLCLSAQSVTKCGDRSPSPTGVNWVSDEVGIDFIEYMCYKSVCFYGSLANGYSRLLRKKQSNFNEN